jgi:hypothetical protein
MLRTVLKIAIFDVFLVIRTARLCSGIQLRRGGMMLE